jgi:hypothetical protein
MAIFEHFLLAEVRAIAEMFRMANDMLPPGLEGAQANQRMTIDDHEDRIGCTDHQARQEFSEGRCGHRAFVNHEAEIPRGTHRRIMLREKRRPVTATTGVSPAGAQVVPV